MNLYEYKYIAHRGLHGNGIIENTLEAFENAIKNNYAIELDVQLTKDNKIVVFHDNNVKRITGHDLYVKDITLEKLKKLKIKESISVIPTLDEVLNLINGKVPLLIEIKNEGKVGSLERKLLEELNKYKGQFMLESFNPFVVRYFKKNSKCLCGLLISKKYTSLKGKILSLFNNFLISTNMLKYDFIAYNFKDLDKNTGNKIKSKKIPLLLWTIDNIEDAKKALKIGDGIIFENIELH